ncbi:MAG: osmotically-inducible protein OsmY [Psychrosphaera sp.]|jgi:osmotically-inducible protein OsmY|uniref:Division/outer membrane stress-associated lipid-binding lipoprotein n=1 Tax=Psychrosphaera aquimarina TaxID=2044854 RepID=A0ABU3R1G6_9GAMM|nr:division/outer membrane stress-associated lipid-binding lipoprotein [Psychrosphaera aquimarina]MDU0113521.1 division/outer membrane stress-associated lipid-binding lipoprotein [Psychrosphaera aquimarina]
MTFTKKLLILALSLSTLQGCATAIVAGTVTAVSAANDPRTIGKQIDDSSIEVTAILELMKDDGVSKHTNINVVSYNGVVLVVGQSPNKFLIDTAINIIKGIDGVKKIHNQIKLGTPASITTQTSDAWITAKVKSELLTDDTVKGHNIKVVTENKEVYLMGLVSKEQSGQAATVASQVTGVIKVITVFEN